MRAEHGIQHVIVRIDIIGQERLLGLQGVGRFMFSCECLGPRI